MSYVWYVGYGSNLHQQRFFCYICGGRPLLGKVVACGCSDRTTPTANIAIKINYQFYFAIPNNGKGTQNWGPGGVAFLAPQSNPNATTYCRMWKLTDAQYQEVRQQEGRSWYDHEIDLGVECGTRIVTITNSIMMKNILLPSDAYLKTIAKGLVETYHFSPDKIADYLLDKEGIKGSLEKSDILRKIV